MTMLIAGAVIMLVGVLIGYGMGVAKNATIQKEPL